MPEIWPGMIKTKRGSRGKSAIRLGRFDRGRGDERPVQPGERTVAPDVIPIKVK